MPMYVSGTSGSGGGSFNLEPGLHDAVAYMIAELGTNMHQFQNDEPKKQEKIAIFWEVQGERDDDDKPITVSHTYTRSLGDNSRLKKDLEKWRGKPFTTEEIVQFDIEKILGVSCILDVGRTSGDRQKVDAVLTSKGGPKKVPTINEQEVFVLADYIREFTGQSDAQSKKMCDLLELLAPFQRELITGSDDGKVQPCFEMQAAKKVDGPTPPAPGSDSSDDDDDDDFEDDIPF